MGVRQCELCDRAARIHCESDQASLCWECDAKVHGANFLVARHSRCLLCRSCQSPTAWRAEGARLGPTVSVCERCAATASARGRKEGDGGGGGAEEEEEEEQGEGGGREEEEEDEEDEEEDDDDGGEEEDDEGDNQVVPWSLTPPAVTSSSSSEGEEESGRTGNGGGLKRMRETADLAVSQDDLACSSSRPSYLASAPAPSPAAAEDEASSFFAPAVRPTTDRKRPALLRPAVGLMTPFLSSSDPNRYKNLQG
ncbi:BBOX [Musa troglodytarum]|uniref:BBOX n=1 Tax=Musa troglodytarum TaxID=320322 RepID=A0A9E7FXL3_9LILI|nr:BBOX [Musa troglodytarum]